MTSNDGENLPAVPALTKAQARRLTSRIADAAEHVWTLLLEARDGRAWDVLGYGSWASYVEAEFGMSRGQGYRLVNQAVVIGELTVAAGLSRARDTIDISARAAEDIKGKLPAVVAQVEAATEGKPTDARPAIVKKIVKRARQVSKKRPPKPVQGSLFDHLGEVLAANRADVVAAVPVDRRLEVADRFQSWADALRRAAGPTQRTAARPEFVTPNFKKGQS